MDNIGLIICYAFLAALSVFLIVVALLRDRGKRLTGNILFLALMFLGWQVTLIAYYACTDIAASYFLFDLCLPFVAFASLAMFLFVMRFYNLDVYHTPLVIVILCVIPIITTIITLTVPYHSFLREGLVILSTFPTHEVIAPRAPWYWMHAAYCYVLIIVAFIIALYQYGKVPPLYKKSSKLLLAGMAVSIGGNVFVLLGVFPTQLDISLVAATVSVYFIYFSARGNQGLDFLNQAKAQIYNEIDEGVLILDESGTVISMNRNARKYLEKAEIVQTRITYQEIQKKIFALAAHYEQLSEEQAGIDYYFKMGGKTYVLNIREREILDNRKNRIATMVTCSNVTENRLTIRELETNAGLDPMTGLLNRRMMQLAQSEIDRKENLPIAVIAGDLDNLKATNDSLGHQQGDIMLRMAAEALTSCCPPSAYIGRTGGDEFLILIPGYSARQAGDLMADINKRMQGMDDYAFKLSLSMGVSVKEREEQDIDMVVRQADAQMYADKKTHRARGGAAQPDVLV